MPDSQVLPSSKRAFWHSQYQQWQSSGLSAAAYCRQNEINTSTFYYWKKVFDRAAGSASAPSRSGSAFIPVSTVSSLSAPGQLSLAIADVTLSVPRDATEAELITWLRAVRAS